MSELSAAPGVWGVFVGDGGDQLPILNRSKGPFPPKPGSEGWIAIGWPAVGEMKIWENDYGCYLSKFQIVYPDNARVSAMRANMPWKFAFEMTPGDWVICPCSSQGVLLVGQITGQYQAEWERWDGTPGLRRDFVHFRQVRWLHVIPKNDSRHNKLNRIGQLAMSRSKLTVERLQGIISGGARDD